MSMELRLWEIAVTRHGRHNKELYRNLKLTTHYSLLTTENSRRKTRVCVEAWRRCLFCIDLFFLVLFGLMCYFVLNGELI